MIIRKSIKRKTSFFLIKFQIDSCSCVNFFFVSYIRLTNLSNCKVRWWGKWARKRREKESFSFVTFLFIIDTTCISFIFSMSSFISMHTYSKKKRKSVIYEWSLLCASPFSQVTRLKVKKSDKFYIPSTFCDYLKRRKKNIRFTFFFYSQRKKRRETAKEKHRKVFFSAWKSRTYHLGSMLMKLIP